MGLLGIIKERVSMGTKWKKEVLTRPTHDRQALNDWEQIEYSTKLGFMFYMMINQGLCLETLHIIKSCKQSIHVKFQCILKQFEKNSTLALFTIHCCPCLVLVHYLFIVPFKIRLTQMFPQLVLQGHVNTKSHLTPYFCHKTHGPKSHVFKQFQ